MSKNTIVSIYEKDLMEYGFEDYPDNHFDGLVSDPPYGLNFMGKKWDSSVPPKEFWEKIYRVMKPGAHLLVFGGTRTFHRLAVAIEDSGFEIRDTMMWIYGSGFPKGRHIYKTDLLKSIEEQLKEKTGRKNIEWK